MFCGFLRSTAAAQVLHNISGEFTSGLLTCSFQTPSSFSLTVLRIITQLKHPLLVQLSVSDMRQKSKLNRRLQAERRLKKPPPLCAETRLLLLRPNSSIADSSVWGTLFQKARPQPICSLAHCSFARMFSLEGAGFSWQGRHASLIYSISFWL